MKGFTASLWKRLDEAEKSFTMAQYQRSLLLSHGILRDLITINAMSDAERTLRQDYHYCDEGCVCKACFALCLQALHQMNNFR